MADAEIRVFGHDAKTGFAEELSQRRAVKEAAAAVGHHREVEA